MAIRLETLAPDALVAEVDPNGSHILEADPPAPSVPRFCGSWSDWLTEYLATKGRTL